MDRPEIHSQGTIIAITLPHVSPKEQGLDVTALYFKEDSSLGLSIIETKAYKDTPNTAISHAVAMFKAVEEGKHDTRLFLRIPFNSTRMRKNPGPNWKASRKKKALRIWIKKNT